jgi:putative ABC transport system permease protein
MNDLKFAFRQLLKNPGFTAVAVLTLALGIGANTAVFSVFHAAMLKPLPYPDPDRLVTLTDWHKKGYTRGTSYPNFVDLRAQNTVCEEMAALSNTAYNLAGDGEPERVLAQRISAGFFPLLGVNPMMGRWFQPEDDRLNAARVAIISHGLWQRRFSGRADILGRAVILNEQIYTIVGIMPADFRTVTGNLYQSVDRPREVWTPLATDTTASGRGTVFLRMIGRLKPGITIDAAASELNTIAERLAQQFPNNNAGFGVRVRGMHRDLGEEIWPAVWILMGAVVILLAIACANVANLFLVRAAARAGEMTVRAALGASRSRIVRQLLTESALIAFTGGILGTILAWTGVDMLRRLVASGAIPIHVTNVNLVVLGFTLAISLGAGFIFGLAPALHAAKVNLNDALKGAARATGASARSRLRNVFVVAEVAFALTLLAGAGLVVKSLGHLLRVNPGFRPENLLTMRVHLPGAKYDEPMKSRVFYDALLERLQALPGVESVGAVSDLPMSGNISTSDFRIEGKPSSPGEMIYTDFQVATADYFSAMGISLLKGRLFSEQDHGQARAVALINEHMASKFWPSEDAIGQRIRIGGQRYEIIGVVGNVRHFGLSAAMRAETYVPHTQRAARSMMLAIRAKTDPMTLARDVRAQVTQLDPNLPLADVRTLKASVAGTTAEFRTITMLLSSFAFAALALAGLGLYGVISYSVAQRTREFGIRLSLGAQRGDVRFLVVRQGVVLTLIGLAIGLAVSFASGRVLTSLLYEVKATDPLTFATVSVVLVAIALVASLIPARRATRIHPMEALRYE